MRGKIDKRIFYKKDSKKFGWNKPSKNKKSKKGYQYDKEYRKARRKLLRAKKHQLFLTGELTVINQRIQEMEKYPYTHFYYEEWRKLYNEYGGDLLSFIIYNKL